MHFETHRHRECRERLVDLRWEAAHGFELTDEIRITISADAAVLLLGLPDDSFRGVHTVLVHPTTVVLRGEHSQVQGIVSDGPMPILGQAELHGPPMADVEQSQHWVEVCTRVYGRVAEGRGGTALRSYAGVNPAEFFAVATEAFFDAPVELRRQQPDLYEVLGGYYHQDPAARWS